MSQILNLMTRALYDDFSLALPPAGTRFTKSEIRRGVAIMVLEPYLFTRCPEHCAAAQLQKARNP